MFEEIQYNKLRSWLILSGFILLIVALGAGFGYAFGSLYFGLGLAAVIGIVYSLVAFYSGDSMILTMSGAKQVTKGEFPHLYHAVEGLAVAAGLKTTPKCYVIKDSALNAFATGRDPEHSSITVTTGLMEKLNRQELEGVIAHEMSHIKNYDIRMMMLAAVLVGVVVLLSDFMLRSFIWGGVRGGRRRNSDSGQAQIILIVIAILMAILAPFFAQLIKLAISRRREYLADASGAALTRYPPGLASALEKIKNDPDPLVDHANRATAHLFISSPFRKKNGARMSLFSTHPPIEERIKRLRSL
jgi:heat shock protein HtpX